MLISFQNFIRNQIVRLPNCQVTKLLGYQIVKLSNYQLPNFQLPNFQVTKLSSYQIVTLPKYYLSNCQLPKCQLPNYQFLIIRPTFDGLDFGNYMKIAYFKFFFYLETGFVIFFYSVNFQEENIHAMIFQNLIFLKKSLILNFKSMP